MSKLLNIYSPIKNKSKVYITGLQFIEFKTCHKFIYGEKQWMEDNYAQLFNERSKNMNRLNDIVV